MFFCVCVELQIVDPPSVRKDRRGRIVKPVIDDTQVCHLIFFILCCCLRAVSVFIKLWIGCNSQSVTKEK